VNDSPESKTSPYEAPEASLDAGEDSGVISAKALHYLVSSKWWMMIASVALMANGVFTVVAVFFTLIKVEGMTPTRKLSLGLVVVAAHLVFLPGLRLMQSALALGRVRQTKEEGDMVHALRRHEEFWKLLGVAFLLVGGLIFYGLLFAIR
jgi:hypothetical protein